MSYKDHLEKAAKKGNIYAKEELKRSRTKDKPETHRVYG